MKELSIKHQELEWKQAQGYPPGTMIKVLRDEGGGQTFLLKLKKGFEMEGCTHMAREQQVVLEGGYEVEGRMYSAGFYRLIPKNTAHGAIKSDQGATILVIWDPE
jgi:anti-sigma factor ChrR (cupin superfamily)